MALVPEGCQIIAIDREAKKVQRHTRVHVFQARAVHATRIHVQGGVTGVGVMLIAVLIAFVATNKIHL